MSLSEIREELRRRYPPLTPITAPDFVEPPVETERAFVVDAKERGSVLITGPATVLRLTAAEVHRNPGFEYIHGRFVEADRPNRNGAFWSTADLELGQTTVAGGPLNWLHEETHVIGTLLGAEMVKGIPAALETADSQPNNHITATAAVWKFLYPTETLAIERAADTKSLWYSMECVSQHVMCLDTPGRPGCGESFGYDTYMHDRDKVCGHLREGSSVRRFVEPVFLGGAILVPPVRPGWAGAEAEVMREAAAVTEENGLAGDALTTPEAQAMVGQLLKWAGTAR